MNQTNHHLFSFFFTVFIIFFLRVSLSHHVTNPKFEACEPKSCGGGAATGLNITYPFFITGRHQRFCGLPRFGLTCSPDGSPILNLSGSYHIVRQIFYNNNSLRLSNPVFSIISNNATQSLSRSQNLTLYGRAFDFAANQKQIFLFFGCAGGESEHYRIGCDAENRTRSVLAMSDDDEEFVNGTANRSCVGGMMTTMVEGNGGRIIWEELRRGFVLNWRSNGDYCGECERSGGRCGFDSEAYSFRCYCQNGDRPDTCSSGLSFSDLSLISLLLLPSVLWFFPLCLTTDPSLFTLNST